MQRTCNIGAKGKFLRLSLGLMSMFAGISLLTLSNLDFIVSDKIFILGIISILGGLFSIWEAREGWCVVRAIGIKTPF
tara:strand:+ start:64 stop:297 length:234 start_codon:yes stop_codon:yes gene_type:complete